MATGDKIYLADKLTLDEVLLRVSNIGHPKAADICTGPISLPYAFYNGSAVVLNNEIHILGGSGGSTNHYKYNGTSWSNVSTLPYAFYNGSAVVLNNEIHILGGSGGSTNHYKYNGTSWSNVSTLPYAFYNGSAVVLNNEIHILGGSGGSTNHYKYNGTSWSNVSTLPYAFYNGSAVVYRDEIHILGTSSVGLDASHYKYNGTSWVSVSTSPSSMSNGAAVVLNDRIYTSNNNLLYSWNGSAWAASTLPVTFSKANMISYKNELHILGGSVSSTQSTHYKLTGGSWSLFTNLPFAFDGGSTVVYNGEIHILGSSNSPINHRRLNPSLEWEVNNTIEATKYYLLKDTKVYCNNSKTIISSGATKTSYGYLINDTGVITISYTDEDSRCFYIV